MNITVFEVGSHVPRPFNEESDIGSTGKAEVFVRINPFDESVLSLPLFFCALHNPIFFYLTRGGVGLAKSFDKGAVNKVLGLRECKRVSERITVLLRVRVVSEARIPPPCMSFAFLPYVRPSIGLSGKQGIV